jgi:hypothetical protein
VNSEKRLVVAVDPLLISRSGRLICRDILRVGLNCLLIAGFFSRDKIHCVVSNPFDASLSCRQL